MTGNGKPEVHLEISSGFFRIPTDEVIYNITILRTADDGPVRVVEKIIEVEKKSKEQENIVENEPIHSPDPLEDTPNNPAPEREDSFYKQISSDIYNDIGKLAKSLSSTITEIPAEDRRRKRVELDEAGEKIEDAKSQLKDIVAMTEDATMAIMDNVESVQSETEAVKTLLSLLKSHKAFESQDPPPQEIAEQEEEDGNKTINELKSKVESAIALLTLMQSESPLPPVAEKPTPTKRTRYLFDLDIVFQTIYELCTNETVKTHISSARQQRDQIFLKDQFNDTITASLQGIEPDSDNFISAPLSDIFTSLRESCTDKGIKNLLKKMETNQASIFLDQSLPLEIPPTEEVEEQGETELPAETSPPEADPRLNELQEILGDTLNTIADLEQKSQGKDSISDSDDFSMMAKEDKTDIFNKIEEAFVTVSQISTNVDKILEALSFQDLSGQQIMKIIKLLGDFQVQLLAIVVSFGSQLKRKEEDKAISVEESKRLAQGDVDSYLSKLAGPEDENTEGLDQSDVNTLLEELGF